MLLVLASVQAVAQPVIANPKFLVNTTAGAAPAQPQSFQFGSGWNYTNGVTGWTTTGYNFVFLPGSATTSVVAEGVDGNLQMWGNYCTASGCPVANGYLNSAPGGSNIIGLDSDYDVAPIQTTITGLVPGETYAVSFVWAGSQQTGYTGGTIDYIEGAMTPTSTVTTYTQQTPSVTNASEGFTGWMYQTFNFTATVSTEVLSFMAVGNTYPTPNLNQNPPFALMADVAMPEPVSAAILISGLAGVFVLARRRAPRRTA